MTPRDAAVASADSTPGPRHIDTHAYWVLEPGNTWVFEQEAHPERLTTIQIVHTTDGGKAAWFTKNHVDTYWGAGGDLDLEWHLTEGATYLYSNDVRDLDDRRAFSAFPDDRRFSRATGQWASDIWWIRGDGETTPPYVLYPYDLTVPSELAGSQFYATRTAQGDSWMAGSWRVRYSTEQQRVVTHDGTTTYDGEVLRLRFDESFWVAPGQRNWIHEDWLLAAGVGPVQIEQYASEERAPAQLTLRIKLRQRSTEPVLWASPQAVTRPTSGQHAVTYRFELRGGQPERTPGVLQVRNPSGPSVLALDPLTTADSWQGSTYVFPWTVGASTPTGTYDYALKTISGQTTSARVTVADAPLRLSVSPAVVARPSSGTTPVTYRFAVSGGEPDRTLGVSNIYHPGAQGNFDTPLDPLATDDRWEGNTYVFPWRITSADALGTYVYQVTDTRGRRALALVEVR